MRWDMYHTPQKHNCSDIHLMMFDLCFWCVCCNFTSAAVLSLSLLCRSERDPTGFFSSLTISHKWSSFFYVMDNRPARPTDQNTRWQLANEINTKDYMYMVLFLFFLFLCFMMCNYVNERGRSWIYQMERGKNHPLERGYCLKTQKI